MSKPTKKWLKMANMYRRFGSYDNSDFSEEAASAMFDYESCGKGNLQFSVIKLRTEDELVNKYGCGRLNGFAVGKHWMDVTIAMWKDGLQNGIITIKELADEFPLWFLERVLPTFIDHLKPERCNICSIGLSCWLMKNLAAHVNATNA